MKIRELFNENEGEVEPSWDIRFPPFRVIDGEFKSRFMNVNGDFDGADIQLRSLKNSPPKVGQSFRCNSNKLQSLEGAPMIVGYNVWAYDNPIQHLKGIGKDYSVEINGFLDIDRCPIKSHMLGILKIKKLDRIHFNFNRKVRDIINKHLESDRDILACQEELIEAGLKEYARL